MTLIYIDANKMGHNYEIEDYVATCEIGTWAYYSRPENMDKWKPIDGKVVDITDTEEYKEKQKQKQIAEFNKEFFNTSLGYIRRKVSMKDGSHKDFLSDLLPTISMAVNMGQEVKVIAYDMPDFEDLKPIEEYQHNEVVTPQFVQECFMQLSADFGVVNESVEVDSFNAR